MPQAYTPGLRVTRHTTIRKQRRLPLEGNVLVAVGDLVTRDQVVAHADLPGKVTTLNLVNKLGCTAEELPGLMLKQEGSRIRIDEPIAESRPLIKWFKTTVNAPITGTIESISRITGQILMREPPSPVELRAYIDGRVVAVIPGQGVDLETEGAYIQGIFGLGGEHAGSLRFLTETPAENLDPDRITSDHQGAVIVCGRRVSIESIRVAQEVGVSAIVGGCLRDSDLREIMGKDLGVAITGQEDLGLAIIVTEGFGQIQMADRTFDLLRSLEGRDASVSGATQIRAGVLRPEIIIAGTEPESSHKTSVGLSPGAIVRGIRTPYFGRVGKVVELPAELQTIESGATVRVARIQFDEQGLVTVPRANIELIEN
jgi:hypothetical protein